MEIGPTALLEQGVQGSGVGKGVERFEDIGIRSRVAAENPTKNGHHHPKIVQVDRSPHRVPRFAEVKNHQTPSRSNHSMHLTESGAEVAQVPQSVGHRRHVETPVRKRQPENIPSEKGRAGGPGARAVGGHAQHGQAEIHGSDPEPGLTEEESDIAGAAAEIESPSVRHVLGPPQQKSLPTSVPTKTLHIVDQVVASRDCGKEVLYLAGMRRAGAVIAVGHWRNETIALRVERQEAR